MGSPSSSLVCSLILTHLPLCLLAHPLEGILQLLLFLLHIPLSLPGHCNLLGHLCILAASENKMSSPWCQGAQLVEGMLGGGVWGAHLAQQVSVVLHQLTVLLLQFAVPLLVGLCSSCHTCKDTELSTWGPPAWDSPPPYASAGTSCSLSISVRLR